MHITIRQAIMTDYNIIMHAVNNVGIFHDRLDFMAEVPNEVGYYVATLY